MKERWYKILHDPQSSDPAARIINGIILALIIASSTTVVLKSIPSVDQYMSPYFRWLDLMAICVFSVEYILRIWSYTHQDGHNQAIIRRVKYALTPLALIDLLAILPFFVPLLGQDLITLRTVRLLRVFRIIRLARYSEALRLLGTVLRSMKENYWRYSSSRSSC